MNMLKTAPIKHIHVRNNSKYEHGVSDSDTLPLKLAEEDDYPDILEHPGFKRWRH